MTQRQPHDLTTSFRAVERARATLATARRNGSHRDAATPEQRELLDALEDCADALAFHGQPISYRMHNELAMYRALFCTRRPPAL
ncbi:hypothetical protein KUV85_00155 [Nocardioides panacisoli]|uniref:hypothetical protein n=1 Tax=Nocardioides panacisoli TaxID=627624 RepID=UPI001C629523|nr:hypothetical protein [Nocardioides panacisoli]QYJ04126.1 hypothetical protein KUV85_00155 [Nocardioides panacisoli]